VTSGVFGKIRICEGEQYDNYRRLGATLATKYVDKFVSYGQLLNATAIVTGNATFEPLCLDNLGFSYKYNLQEQNVSNWGILLASLERTAQKGKTICACNLEKTLFYITDEFQKLGENPTNEASDSVLQSFGYLQHPDWYANCPVVENYLHRLAYEQKYTAPYRMSEKRIREMKVAFEQGGKELIHPLLINKIGKQDSFLDVLRRKNEFYCYIYNSSAKIFAQKNESLGNQEMRFLVETVWNETGHPRMDASCLNYFLEEFGRQGDALGTPLSVNNMLESLYRNNELLSTVTDYDKCECRIPSLSKKLVGDLVGLGPTPNEALWNGIMKTYWYIPWSLNYRSCPILEWYLEAIGQKYGVQTAERRFLEVGFDMAKVLHSFSEKTYWR